MLDNKLYFNDTTLKFLVKFVIILYILMHLLLSIGFYVASR